MTINEKIKQIVDTIEGLNFEYNDWSRANVTLSKKPLPICVCLPPVSGEIITKNGNIRDRRNMLVAFLDKAEFDYEGKVNEKTVDNMKLFAKRFIVALNKSGMFKTLPDTVKYSVCYDRLDDNLTGIILDFDLEDLQGGCYG